MNKIDFLVLACSYKEGNRCLAGVDLTNKRLIRLVTDNPEIGYSVPSEWCGYDGKEITINDVLEIDLGNKAPTLGAQNENYFVKRNFILKKIRRGRTEDFKKFITYDVPFDTDFPAIRKDYYSNAKSSLCLVIAYNFNIVNGTNDEGKSRNKANFIVYKKNYQHECKKFSITDPNYYGEESVGTHIDRAYLLISIPAHTYNGSDYYYKFVAGIIDFKSIQ